MLQKIDSFIPLVAVVGLGLAGCAHAPEEAPMAHDIRTEEVSYQAGDTKMKGFLAWDASIEGRRPGVLVVHEWWGHNEYARDRAKQLAAMGYTALAVDMFGDGKQANHPQEAGAMAGQVMKNIDVGVARFEAARKILEEHPSTDAEKTAAIGYCFGGGIVLHMARIGMDLDLVASFHGSLSPVTPAQPGGVKAKVLVYHGGADEFISAEVVEAFQTEMKEAGADFEFTAYPGAKHAFTNPAATENGKKFGIPLAYDQKADEESWKAFTSAMKRQFGEK